MQGEISLLKIPTLPGVEPETATCKAVKLQDANGDEAGICESCIKLNKPSYLQLAKQLAVYSNNSVTTTINLPNSLTGSFFVSAEGAVRLFYPHDVTFQHEWRRTCLPEAAKL